LQGGKSESIKKKKKLVLDLPAEETATCAVFETRGEN
jgi:hypothetical protein